MTYLRIPDLNFVEKMTDENLSARLAALACPTDIPNDMSDGSKIIEGFIKVSKNKSPEKICSDLSVEYTRLFRGVKRSYGPPPPYESVYVEKGLVMGESTAEVKKKYTEAGVALANNLKGEPPDHIGLELDFMRHLCGEEADAWGGGKKDMALKHLDMENAFLREHLVKWIPKFCDIIVKETKLDFYRGLARLTKGFIKYDMEQLDSIIDMAKYTNLF